MPLVLASSVSLGEALVLTRRMVGTRAATYALCKVRMQTRTSAERTTAMRQTEIRSEGISKPDLSDGVITLSTASVRMATLRKTQKKKTVVRLKLHARVK